MWLDVAPHDSQDEPPATTSHVSQPPWHASPGEPSGNSAPLLDRCAVHPEPGGGEHCPTLGTLTREHTWEFADRQGGRTLSEEAMVCRTRGCHGRPPTSHGRQDREPRLAL